MCSLLTFSSEQDRAHTSEKQFDETVQIHQQATPFLIWHRVKCNLPESDNHIESTPVEHVHNLYLIYLPVSLWNRKLLLVVNLPPWKRYVRHVFIRKNTFWKMFGSLSPKVCLVYLKCSMPSLCKFWTRSSRDDGINLKLSRYLMPSISNPVFGMTYLYILAVCLIIMWES